MKLRDKSTRVILSGNAKESFRKLNEVVGMQIRAGKEGTLEVKLFHSIKGKIELIKKNPFYENNIKKNLIPKKYNVSSLWRIELINFWKMLYTVRGDDIEIVCFILGLVGHPTYNETFGYKKR